MFTRSFVVRGAVLLATLGALVAWRHVAGSGAEINEKAGASQDREAAAAEHPRELAMRSLPAYRIEPPDILQIEVPKLVPLPPYRFEAYDVLQIQVVGTLVDKPIDGYFLIDQEGLVNLGPGYGSVRIAGMTIKETTTAITKQLEIVLKAPEVSVQLARIGGTQAVNGTYLVSPDGMVNLRQYGMVHVAGKTILETRLAIQKQLSLFFDSPDVSVDIAGYKSKVYYVITAVAGKGDDVVRVPITGNETVLDAISQIGGLPNPASKKIWVARPAPPESGKETVLPVDWEAISRRGATATNYQLLPGDRVVIDEDSTPRKSTSSKAEKLP
jgi:polysaccharide biosynthesis/export protein